MRAAYQVHKAATIVAVLIGLLALPALPSQAGMGWDVSPPFHLDTTDPDCWPFMISYVDFSGQSAYPSGSRSGTLGLYSHQGGTATLHEYWDASRCWHLPAQVVNLPSDGCGEAQIYINGPTYSDQNCPPVANLEFRISRDGWPPSLTRTMLHRVVADRKTLEAHDLHGSSFGEHGDLQGLLEAYAPVLRFCEGERYRPVKVEVNLHGAQLRSNRVYPGANIVTVPPVDLGDLTPSDLARYSWTGFTIDPPCDPMNPDECYTAFQQGVNAVQQPDVIYATAIVDYGSVGDGMMTDHVVLQYWMNYYYNDYWTYDCKSPHEHLWFVHHGEWEHISIALDMSLTPHTVSYAAHRGYTAMPWDMVEKWPGSDTLWTTHPVVYVSRGAHGSYPHAGHVCKLIYESWLGNGPTYAPENMPGAFDFNYSIVQLPRWTSLPEVGTAGDWVQFAGYWGTGRTPFHHEGRSEVETSSKRDRSVTHTWVPMGPSVRRSWVNPIGEEFKNLCFNVACPVDILVRDPLDREIGPEVNTIPRARYEVWQADSTDVNAGRSANVIIPYPVAGQYHVEVILLDGADPDQTYTLWSTRNWIGAETDTLYLAEDVPVVEIPSEGYYVIPDVPFVGHSEVTPDTWMADWEIGDTEPVEWRLTSPDGFFSVHDLDWGSFLLNGEVSPFSIHADTSATDVSLVILFPRGESLHSMSEFELGVPVRIRLTGVFEDPVFRLESNAEIVVEAGVLFTRGDSDGSGEINISDPIFSLAYQFAGGDAPPCLKAADVDGNGEVNISDPIYNLHYQFAGGPAPLAPFPACGVEPNASSLSCDSFEPCESGFRGGYEPVVHDAGLWDFHLRAPSSWSGDALRVDLWVVTAEPVLGFEGLFTYDTRSLEFAGIEKAGVGESMQFLAAREDLDLGGTRLGAVHDFNLSAPLEAGVHRLGSLVFTRREAGGGGAPMSPSRTVALKSARFVLEDLQAIVIGEGGGETELPASVEEWDGEGASEARRPPVSLTLLPAVPNPATGFTRLEFGMPTSGTATLSIYDVAGREVRRLGSGEHQPGWHSVIWDGRGDDGRRLSQGIYFARLRAGAEVQTERVTLIR